MLGENKLFFMLCYQVHISPLVCCVLSHWGKVLSKTWMTRCWKSGLNIAKMANLGQLAIKTSGDQTERGGFTEEEEE